jgi:hypothetical protein
MSGADFETDALLRRVPAGPDPPEDAHPDEGVWRTWRDGGLEARRLAELDDHLAACALCRSYVRAIAHGVPAERLAAVTEASLGAITARRAAWRAPVVLGGLAAAAALTIALWSPGSPRFSEPPAYEITQVSGPRQGARGPESASEHLLPDAEFAVTLRPTKPLAGPAPLVAVFHVTGDAPPAAIDASAVRWSRDGTVMVRGRADMLFGPVPAAPTPLELWVVFASEARALERFEPARPSIVEGSGLRVERMRFVYGRSEGGP